jgi:DNA modification methylase
MMMPARLAIALCDDGWWLRSEIVWAKPNPMPESCKDRPTSAHEKIYLLAKSSRYFYDADAVRISATSESIARYDRGRSDTHKWADGGPGNQTIARSLEHMRPKKSNNQRGHGRRHNGFNDRWDAMPVAEQRSFGANLRNVWDISVSGFPEAHFATFPTELAERCIKAGCPLGGTVLDPFGGSGTTGLVADRLGRNAILLELNPKYAEMARRRIESDAPMFAEASLQKPTSSQTDMFAENAA